MGSRWYFDIYDDLLDGLERRDAHQPYEKAARVHYVPCETSGNCRIVRGDLSDYDLTVIARARKHDRSSLPVVADKLAHKKVKSDHKKRPSEAERFRRAEARHLIALRELDKRNEEKRRQYREQQRQAEAEREARFMAYWFRRPNPCEAKAEEERRQMELKAEEARRQERLEEEYAAYWAKTAAGQARAYRKQLDEENRRSLAQAMANVKRTEQQMAIEENNKAIKAIDNFEEFFQSIIKMIKERLD